MSRKDSPDEEWRPVGGYEGAYEVSDRGRVRSLDRTVSRRGHGLILRGKVLKPSRHPYGYEQVPLWSGGKKRNHLIHQLVAFAFLGSRPDGLVVRHGPRGMLDNRPNNLSYGTYSDNNLDRNRDGTSDRRNRTQCTQGHRLVVPNLVPRRAKVGRRECLACARGRSAVYNAKNRRNLKLDLQAVSDRYYAEIMGDHPDVRETA